MRYSKKLKALLRLEVTSISVAVECLPLNLRLSVYLRFFIAPALQGMLFESVCPIHPAPAFGRFRIAPVEGAHVGVGLLASTPEFHHVPQTAARPHRP